MEFISHIPLVVQEAQRRLRLILKDLWDLLTSFNACHQVSSLSSDDSKHIENLTTCIRDCQPDTFQTESDCQAKVQHLEERRRYIFGLDQALLKAKRHHRQGKAITLSTFDAVQKEVQGQVAEDIISVEINTGPSTEEITKPIETEVEQLLETSLALIKEDLTETKKLLDH